MPPTAELVEELMANQCHNVPVFERAKVAQWPAGGPGVYSRLEKEFQDSFVGTPQTTHLRSCRAQMCAS